MSAAHLRSHQVSAVKQLLAPEPAGLTRQQLRVLLGKHADHKQLDATLNTMLSRGVIRKFRAPGGMHFALATENLLQPAVRTRVQRLTPAQADSARQRAASLGVAAVIPPSATATGDVETVEQWMRRTGKKPEVLPHNFDAPITSWPGRRPITNPKRNAA